MLRRLIFIPIVLLFIFVASLWLIFKTTSPLGFIALLLTLYFTGRFFLSLLLQKNILRENQFSNFHTALVSLVFVLLAGEMIIRVVRADLASYMERNGSFFYSSPYGKQELPLLSACDNGHFFVSPPHDSDYLNRPEFNFLHQYNAYGLRERDIPLQKAEGEYRILGLGDSFMEGVGAHQDSTWLRLLENRLNAATDSMHFTTINAGKSGSDLFFSYELLEKCLIQFQPDLVILQLNSSDIFEVMGAGGEERWNDKGKLVAKAGPRWDFFYGSSYLVRLFAKAVFQIEFNLMNPEIEALETQKALDKISRKIEDYYKLSSEKGFEFLLALQPMHYELISGKSPLEDIPVSTDIRMISLTDYMAEIIAERGDSIGNYYWTLDLHFNQKGNQLVADGVYEKYFLPCFLSE